MKLGSVVQGAPEVPADPFVAPLDRRHLNVSEVQVVHHIVEGATLRDV
jgi:hypothetical protein